MWWFPLCYWLKCVNYYLNGKLWKQHHQHTTIDEIFSSRSSRRACYRGSFSVCPSEGSITREHQRTFYENRLQIRKIPIDFHFAFHYALSRINYTVKNAFDHIWNKPTWIWASSRNNSSYDSSWYLRIFGNDIPNANIRTNQLVNRLGLFCHIVTQYIHDTTGKWYKQLLSRTLFSWFGRIRCSRAVHQHNCYEEKY